MSAVMGPRLALLVAGPTWLRACTAVAPLTRGFGCFGVARGGLGWQGGTEEAMLVVAGLVGRSGRARFGISGGYSAWHKAGADGALRAAQATAACVFLRLVAAVG